MPFKGDVINYVTRVPLGVVGIISSFNHPLLISLKKIAPALSAGNCVVVKPSEIAPINVLRFGELCFRAGLPAGVLNIVCGYGHEAGVALTNSSLISLIDFTGGTATGRKIASKAGENLIGYIAELGGKAPVIVFADADLEQAVNGSCFAAFIASGQTCVMGSRVLVHEKILKEFTRRFVAKAKAIQLMDPKNEKCQMGPVISSASLGRVDNFVQEAVKDGCTIECGGKRFGNKGYFYGNRDVIDDRAYNSWKCNENHESISGRSIW
jgi:acyl-CoA reductase-like NAD-dependent aldehyde dehydrogenase